MPLRPQTNSITTGFERKKGMLNNSKSQPKPDEDYLDRTQTNSTIPAPWPVNLSPDDPIWLTSVDLNLVFFKVTLTQVKRNHDPVEILNYFYLRSYFDHAHYWCNVMFTSLPSTSTTKVVGGTLMNRVGRHVSNPSNLSEDQI